jgi:hypothetical protein
VLVDGLAEEHGKKIDYHRRSSLGCDSLLRALSEQVMVCEFNRQVAELQVRAAP